jgi:hypothetical protein
VPFEQPALRLPRAWSLPEEMALTLGLLFRSLAPMRSRDNLRNVVEGIEQMGKEVRLACSIARFAFTGSPCGFFRCMAIPSQ